ncbi:hypothetical protein O7600_27865 [Micromonospora sp. WMMA1998]|uniref:hypothetical protein n=1 Tax=Micromonospora sp. WMMA1998 TaxID=3015167 RepID=UPI00248C3BD8|nr:hypothetical protein [Micromonospora sp. WMMA1998]WBC14851.1 hypothetical protein O7600_27865 [Micromonospora sp. WMMA1998]
MVAWQKIALGRVHAGKTVTITVSDTELAIECDDGIRTVRRINQRPVTRINAPPERPHPMSRSTAMQHAPRAQLGCLSTGSFRLRASITAIPLEQQHPGQTVQRLSHGFPPLGQVTGIRRISRAHRAHPAKFPRGGLQGVRNHQRSSLTAKRPRKVVSTT